MKRLFCILLVAVAAMCVLNSCSQDDSVVNEEGITLQSGVEMNLQAALTEIIENKSGEYDEGGYIIKDTESDSLIVCNELVYSIASSFSESSSSLEVQVSSSSSSVKKAPKGNGWKWAGSCKKDKFSQIKLIKDVAGKLPPETAFEVHVEYDSKSGTYNAWYRLI